MSKRGARATSSCCKTMQDLVTPEVWEDTVQAASRCLKRSIVFVQRSQKIRLALDAMESNPWFDHASIWEPILCLLVIGRTSGVFSLKEGGLRSQIQDTGRAEGPHRLGTGFCVGINDKQVDQTANGEKTIHRFYKFLAKKCIYRGLSNKETLSQRTPNSIRQLFGK